MKNILETTKDFKIIPNNFKSSGEFEVVSISNNDFKVKLILADKEEYKDYSKGENVEVFGINNVGLVYFETSILERKENILTLAITQDYSIIQRREYSRVKLSQGRLVFKDLPENFVEKIEDVSAGGIKFICREELSIDKIYEAEIDLSNNMKINCSMQPIRITESNDKYAISARFNNLEDVDRVVLVQYAFKIKMENQNKDD